MTREFDTDIEQAAVQWHVQVLAGSADWDAFARWLDEAPDHQPAYDRIAMIDAEVEAHVREFGMPELTGDSDMGAHDIEPVGRTRRWWIGGAVAASLTAAILGLPHVLAPVDQPALYATADSQRTIGLPGGGKVTLDAHSQLTMSSGGKIRMDKGAAYFDVRHENGRALEIQSGAFSVRDIGTRFTVTRGKSQLFVAVEQGIVDVAWRDQDATRLNAGQAFQGEERTGDAVVSETDPASVASWRQGRLVYDNAPLPLVAADLSRYTGTPVEVDPAIAHLKLSGILLIRNGSDLVDQISTILPIEARRDDRHIRLVGRSGR
ncbi:FecR family protein [Sphingobium yanoikuyae]|uniref:FecR family protein n=1 Tax=Sphingobium yanoikuyae TaxID=13690 RepID=UPI00241C0AA0|nr:FecR domain-containing protein [Sphingobium yanoikuyae]